jgi:signal transduction histidine kinase
MIIVFIVFIFIGRRLTAENVAIQDDTYRTHFQSRLTLKSINGLNNSRSQIIMGLKENNIDFIFEAEDLFLGAHSNYKLLLSEQSLIPNSRQSLHFQKTFNEISEVYNRFRDNPKGINDVLTINQILEQTTELAENLHAEESQLWIDESLKFHAFSQVKLRNQNVFYALTICFAFVQILIAYFSILSHRLSRKVNLQHEQILLQDRLSTLGMMSAELAHEINSPLMVIDGRLKNCYNDLLEESVNRDRLQKNLDTVKRNSKRIQDILKNFKTMSKTGVNDVWEDIELESIFEEVADLTEHKINKSEIKLTFTRVSSEIVVCCRKIQIVQVISNLINNSIDAIQHLPDPWIEVNVDYLKNNEIQISVTDSGSGIPNEMAPYIFDAFVSTKTSEKGTGLGLSISKKIMKDHGGDLIYNSKSPRTQFILSIKQKMPTQNEWA